MVNYEPKDQLTENRESILKSTTVEEALRYPEIVSHGFIHADILYAFTVKTNLLKERNDHA